MKYHVRRTMDRGYGQHEPFELLVKGREVKGSRSWRSPIGRKSNFGPVTDARDHSPNQVLCGYFSALQICLLKHTS